MVEFLGNLVLKNPLDWNCDEDVFYDKFTLHDIPVELKEIIKNDFTLMNPVMGGVMYGSIKPHVDDFRGKPNTICWFSGFQNEMADPWDGWLFADDKWHHVKEGDIVYFTSANVHAFITSEEYPCERWGFIAIFAKEKK